LFDKRTLITIINYLVFSKLLYCSSVWANTTKKNIELSQTVQNFAAWIVSGMRKFDHVTPMLKQDRLHIPLCKTAAGQRAFTFRGQKLWNSLPDEFQSITNLDVFKVKIKQHF
ncbi:unnamed protein product, partial [Porites lobata]